MNICKSFHKFSSLVQSRTLQSDKINHCKSKRFLLSRIFTSELFWSDINLLHTIKYSVTVLLLAASCALPQPYFHSLASKADVKQEKYKESKSKKINLKSWYSSPDIDSHSSVPVSKQASLGQLPERDWKEPSPSKWFIWFLKSDAESFKRCDFWVIL